MSKFTPGKWEVDGFGQAISVFDEREEATLFIVDNVYSWANRDGEAEANARLIAAAPEMYAIVEWVASLAENQRATNVMIQEARELIKRVDDLSSEDAKHDAD